MVKDSWSLLLTRLIKAGDPHLSVEDLDALKTSLAKVLKEKKAENTAKEAAKNDMGKRQVDKNTKFNIKDETAEPFRCRPTKCFYFPWVSAVDFP